MNFNEWVDAEIEQIRLYLDACIEVAFNRPEQKCVMPSKECFDRSFKCGRPHFSRSLWVLPDGKWVIGHFHGAAASDQPNEIARQYYYSIYGVEFGFSRWVMNADAARRIGISTNLLPMTHER